MAYSLARQTWYMLRIEILGDIRKPTVPAAAALQVFSLCLLCFLGNPVLNATPWNSLFWLTIVFCTLQAVSKTFISVSRARWIYLNQLASPTAIILAKTIYAWLLMLIISILDLGVFSFFLSNPVAHMLPYMGFVLLVSAGLGTIFTMISAIASKTTQSAFLVPVLSLPVILPILLIGVQGSVKCLNPVLVPSVYTDLLLLGAINFLVLVLSAILFNPLWRE